MKWIKAIVFFLFLSFTTLSKESKGKEFYVGDKISIKVSGDISSESIKKSLENYKIYSLERLSESSYIVTFGSYEVGEKEIILGDKKLTFKIGSTLKEEETVPYEELFDINNKYDEKDYPYIAILSLLLSLSSIFLALIFNILDRLKNPYIIFKKEISNVDENNWREKISLELRRYIDNIYKTNFLGGEYKAIFPLTNEDINFMQEMDYLKFAPTIGTKDENRLKYKKKALEIVERVRKERK